jgi:uncharacterized integral membrane protein (TIGR00697 family)
MNTTQTDDSVFIVLVSVFVGSITIASVLATKIIQVAGMVVPAGVLAYSLTFIATDVISEIWGRKRANLVVMGGFVALLIVCLLVQISLAWPRAPFWEHDQAYQTILGSTARIIVASFTAYLLSQFHDVWAFHFWKKKTGVHHLWLRNNLSTAASQCIDSFVFITIAFYGLLPIWPLILGQWIVKLTISLLDTPVVYAIVWLLRRRQPTAPLDSARPVN